MLSWDSCQKIERMQMRKGKKCGLGVVHRRIPALFCRLRYGHLSIFEKVSNLDKFQWLVPLKRSLILLFSTVIGWLVYLFHIWRLTINLPSKIAAAFDKFAHCCKSALMPVDLFHVHDVPHVSDLIQIYSLDIYN